MPKRFAGVDIDAEYKTRRRSGKSHEDALAEIIPLVAAWQQSVANKGTTAEQKEARTTGADLINSLKNDDGRYVTDDLVSAGDSEFSAGGKERAATQRASIDRLLGTRGMPGALASKTPLPAEYFAPAKQPAAPYKPVDPITEPYKDITVPILEEMEPILEGDQSRFHIDPSIGRQTVADPESVAAMRRAMAEMEEISQQGGYSDADLSRQQLARHDIDQQARQMREAGQANLQARGLSNSGNDLAMMMGASQGATQAKALSDARMNAEIGDRAMDALQKSFTMGGDLQTRYQNVGNANAQIDRGAHVANQGIDQSGALRDIGEERRAQGYNLGLPERNFGNQLMLAGRTSGAAATSAGHTLDRDRFRSEDERWRLEREDRQRELEDAQEMAINGALIGIGESTVGGLMGTKSMPPAGAAQKSMPPAQARPGTYDQAYSAIQRDFDPPRAPQTTPIGQLNKNMMSIGRAPNQTGFQTGFQPPAMQTQAMPQNPFDPRNQSRKWWY